MKTMLKKEDWGGLTILSLLATIAFPPYFVHLMTMAALSELGHLWSTRLDRLQKDRLVEFEKEFRKGYQMEKTGNVSGAIAWYRKLERTYDDLPQASKLAMLQIRSIESKIAKTVTKKSVQAATAAVDKTEKRPVRKSRSKP
jgi:hypothetical protein